MPSEYNPKNLPSAPGDPSARYLPAPTDLYRSTASATWDVEPEEAAIPMSHYFWVLRRHYGKMIAFVATCVLAAVIVSVRLTPVYESTVTVDIDRRIPAGIIGQEANQSSINDADQFLATQIKLVQSDSVLRPVAHKYGVGEPGGVGEAPVVMKRLSVVRPPNTYLLLIGYRSEDPQLAANVANGIAQSYLDHTYNIRFRSSASLSAFMEKQLDELHAKMERSSAALVQFERELNVINPEEKTNILSARLLQLNTEQTNAQTDRIRKQSAFDSVKHGSLEAAQASSQGEALKKLAERVDEAQQRFVEVSAHFGANHPENKRAAAEVAEIQRQIAQARQNIARRVEVEFIESSSREAMLNKAVAEAKTEFDLVNARSVDYQSLQREAEADKKLYEELVRKIKEAGINAGFQNSSIRIADPARPGNKPVFPNIPLNVALAFLLSSVFAFAFAIVGDSMNTTVRDPDQVSRGLNTEVIGVLPAVKNWRGSVSSGPNNRLLTLPAAGAPAATSVVGFDEAVRTLRNSIFLTDFDRRIRTLMVTSAAPSEGKSTVATNLAMAHAQQGHRTLLIDGDLRRPSIHRRFDLPGTVGLSDVLLAGASWQEALVAAPDCKNLDILVAGPPSRRATDLIGTRLSALLEEAGRQYDLIILDSPPLLGFPEPLQMAAAADGVLIIARAGQTNRKALSAAITTLTRLRANVVGVAINELSANSGNNYYYHYYHSKYYQHYDKSGAAV